MIGAPDSTWEEMVANGAAYYTGYGSGEVFWTLVAVAICVITIIAGGIGEGKAYKRNE